MRPTDLDRWAWPCAALLFLVGCTEPPSVVSTTGSDPETGGTSSTTEPGPTSTTESSATVGSADGTATSTTGETAPPMPLDGSGTTGSTTETTVDPSSSSSSGSSGDPTTTGMETTTGGIPDCNPILAEVQYDTKDGEDMEQWVRLYNPCPADIDLGDYSLGWAGTDWTYGTMDLGLMGPNTISASGCFVVGGPISDSDNQNAMFDLEMDFNPNMEKGNSPGKGMALFFGAPASIMPNTAPVDAVIYGDNNDSMLIDVDGAIAPDAHVNGSGDDKSVRRTAIAGPGWEVADPPTPNDCPAIP